MKGTDGRVGGEVGKRGRERFKPGVGTGDDVYSGFLLYVSTEKDSFQLRNKVVPTRTKGSTYGPSGSHRNQNWTVGIRGGYPTKLRDGSVQVEPPGKSPRDTTVFFSVLYSFSVYFPFTIKCS